MADVLQLVRSQIAASHKPICSVLLVGGFGASIYLKERLRDTLGANVKVLQPPNAWQAVVMGAVMQVLAQCVPKEAAIVKIENRKARKHYGVELRSTWNHSQLCTTRCLAGSHKIITIH